MKLKRFKKNTKQKKIALSLLGMLAITLSLLVGRTYALYKKETEVTFINTKVKMALCK